MAFCASLGYRWQLSYAWAAARGAAWTLAAEFFRDVSTAINQTAGEGAQVILAGPGFAKEDLKKVIDSSYPDLAERISMDDASSIGRSGFQEVLRRGAVKSVLESSRIAKEAKLIEDLFQRDRHGRQGRLWHKRSANCGELRRS